MLMYQRHDTGLDITGSIPLAQCGQLLEQWRGNKDALTWHLADLLVYARDKYGDDIYQYLDQTNWSESTIANYMTTARKIPRAGRRVGVSFSNHSELTSLNPEQIAYALDKLESKEWTREDLREWKRELKGDNSSHEQVITLQVKALTSRQGILTIEFIAPDERYEIIAYQAVVVKRQKSIITMADIAE